MEQNLKSVCGAKDISGVEDGIDRISGLPDSVLCYILSFLPTKYAVATSILSTRFKDLFPSILDLDIEFDDSMTESIEHGVARDYTTFRDFCNRVFDFHLRDVKSIRSLKLLLSDCVSGTSFEDITRWITSALQLNVKKIELLLDYYYVQYDIPDVIFTSTSLEVLILVGGWRLNSTNPVVELPRLRVLRLVNDPVVIGHRHVSSILNGSPVLEELVLNSVIVNEKILDISLPKLKRLEMRECNYHYNHSVEIILDSPDLQYLYLNDRLARDYIIKNLDVTNEVYADLRIRQIGGGSVSNVMKLFQRCSGVRILTLSGTTMEILGRSRCLLPVFHNLTRLDLGSVSAPLLAELLNKTPKLEVLVLGRGITGDLEASLPEKVPACVSSHLREIRISDCNSRISTPKALRYFLGVGAALKKIIVGTSVSPEEQLCTKLELLGLPRCSETCEVELLPDGVFCSKFCKLSASVR